MFNKKGYMRNYGVEYRKRKGPKLSAAKVAWKREKSRKEHTADAQLILGPYKEPLRKVEKGFGYEGALTFDVKGRLQCHVCGAMHDHLALHLRLHKMTAKKYREDFKLSPSTALISERQREDYKLQGFRKFNALTADQKAEMHKKSKERWRKWYENGGKAKMSKDRLSLEVKNKRGICPDQLLALIKGVHDNLGHTPSQPEFIDYYKTQRYMPPIKRTFGSWAKAVKACGFELKQRRSPKGIKRKRYSDDELLDLLNGFYLDTGRIPMSSDCRRGFLPDAKIFAKRFGSFAEARHKAGMKDWYDKRNEQGQNARQEKTYEQISKT
jgi:hypothetical protein